MNNFFLVWEAVSFWLKAFVSKQLPLSFLSKELSLNFDLNNVFDTNSSNLKYFEINYHCFTSISYFNLRHLLCLSLPFFMLDILSNVDSS